MTWNVWWRFGPWRERREAILSVLRDLRPDLVGLQEVWGRGEDNLAGWLAGELGMHWTWAPSDTPGRWHRRLGDSAFDVGDAVLSRWPVAEHATLRLPAAGGADDGHTVLYARVEAPGQPVPLFTTHLNSAPHESAVRCAQVGALAGFVASHRAGTPFPPVLTGDCNAVPDSDEMRLLGGHRTAPPVPGQVLLDAWLYADPAAPSSTWDPANPYVARTFEPAARIDYVHVGAPGPDGLGRVLRVFRAGDAPVEGVWPSDHAAVVADLADGPAAPPP
ncbi:endonuclease/exonuclease/phosphatase family protein [Planomonospora corallina]|uniref:Endonuclease/exonuclease/phosphatase family protein n=1 Tax=Planomonospora corallina TaxID=1806052 RepID=A0ABV8IAV9_9ACTN